MAPATAIPTVGTLGTIPSIPFGEVRSGPIESAMLSISASDSRGSGFMMLLFSQDSLGTVSSRAGPNCFGSRMKRRTGSPGGWVPVAATIEYERPDLVRLKLWSKASVVPFEERSWSGWLGEDMISVKIREEKSAWKFRLENKIWAQTYAFRFSRITLFFPLGLNCDLSACQSCEYIITTDSNV